MFPMPIDPSYKHTEMFKNHIMIIIPVVGVMYYKSSTLLREYFFFCINKVI